MLRQRKIAVMFLLLLLLIINAAFVPQIVSYLKFDKMQEKLAGSTDKSDNYIKIEGNFMFEYSKLYQRKIIVPVTNNYDTVKYLVIFNKNDIAEIRKAIETGNLLIKNTENIVFNKADSKILSLFRTEKQIIIPEKLTVVNIKHNSGNYAAFIITDIILIILILFFTTSSDKKEIKQSHNKILVH